MRPGLRRYILDGHTPVRCTDRMAFIFWMAKTDQDGTRRVAIDEIGGWEVSTVFLGVDHGWGLTDKPVLFETMLFDAAGKSTGLQRRYHTWEEAEAGHREVCADLRAKQPAPRQ